MCREEAGVPVARVAMKTRYFLFIHLSLTIFKPMKDYLRLYENCTLCPRGCNALRSQNIPGYCGCTSALKVSRAALHMWEEPCISGSKGSGTVFFSGCSLHCIYCQNHEISGSRVGKEISLERLVEIFFELKDKGAANINLVTPTHYTPHIVAALTIAKERGLNIPVIYNTSGYERPETLELLRGLVDVFLPDYKYSYSSTASLFSRADDYPEVTMSALRKMYELVGEPSFEPESGYIQKGIIVRVLVLPGHTNEAIESIRRLYDAFGDNIYISIMSQYTPVLADSFPAGSEYDSLKRTLTKREYGKVVNYALDLGLKNAFIQEGKVCLQSFIPPFNEEGV